MSGQRSLIAAVEAAALPDDGPQLRTQPEQLLRQLRCLRMQLERERHRSARLQKLVERDFLTGLANSRGFTRALKQALSEIRRYARPMSLACFDLDGFKVVNDRLGHRMGDEVLRRVGLKLADCVRVSDVVARLGGDEFAVLFRNVRPDDLVSKLSKLEREITFLNCEFRGPRIGLSTGVTELRASDTVAEALDRADCQMYRDKACNAMRRTVSGP